MPATVRASMSDLITRVRALIGDPTGATQTFDDPTVQDWLDRTRQIIRYELLRAAPDIVPVASNASSQLNWATYVSDYGDWEADAVLQGNLSGTAWHILTPVTSDYLTGRWTFDVTLPSISTSIPAQLPPVFIVGKVYDPYLAAAYLLEMWAALVADAYDFTASGQSFHRSQRGAAKLQLARTYRMSAKPTMAEVTRSDMRQPSSVQPVSLIGDGNANG